MLGGSEFRLRQGFRLRRKHLYGAKAPPHRVGPHVLLSSILFRCSKTKGHPLGCPFVLGSGGQRPPPSLTLKCSAEVNSACAILRRLWRLRIYAAFAALARRPVLSSCGTAAFYQHSIHRSKVRFAPTLFCGLCGSAGGGISTLGAARSRSPSARREVPQILRAR